MSTALTALRLPQAEVLNETGHLAPRPAQAISPEILRSFSEGIHRLNTGQVKPAAEALEEVIAIHPNFADAHIALGIAFAMDARVYPALDHLKRAAELEPDNFYAHFKLAQLFFKLRTTKKGYEAASHALRCVTSLEEKKLVAQLLKEERQREHHEIQRPQWSARASRISAWVAAMMGLAAILMLIFHLG